MRFFEETRERLLLWGFGTENLNRVSFLLFREGRKNTQNVADPPLFLIRFDPNTPFYCYQIKSLPWKPCVEQLRLSLSRNLSRT